MSLATIIIDGEGVTAQLGTTPITDINTVAFSVRGARPEINLTTIDATKYKVKLLGKLQKISDVVINVKSNPQLVTDLYSKTSEALAIGFKIGKETTKTLTYYAQFKGSSASTLERAPGDGVNVDLNFFITNISANTETGPAIT